LKQLSISERRQIVIKVATPLGSEEGSVDSVRLDLSPEDIHSARMEGRFTMAKSWLLMKTLLRSRWSPPFRQFFEDAA
jgi:hypothetical protein